MRQLTLRILAGFVLGTWCLAAGATHEVDHRYTVVGVVSYPDGTPAKKYPIRLMAGPETALGEYHTDE